jgi:hypothetical protein
MSTRPRKRRATKAIRYADGKVTHIEPAAKNVKAKVNKPPSGGISLSLSMDASEENDDH